VDFWQAMEARQSVRAFDQQRDVPPDVVTRLLHAAIRAPSAGNCQPWHFFVVRDQETKKALARAALNQWFLSEAPVVIVVCADPERSARRYGDRGRNLYSLQDTAAAAENLLLAAVASALAGSAPSTRMQPRKPSTCPRTCAPWPWSRSVIRPNSPGARQIVFPWTQ